MMPSMDRMQRIALEHPEASHFVMSPGAAKYAIEHLIPMMYTSMKDVWPKPGSEMKLYIHGREVMLSPSLSDGDFFPIYASTLTNIFKHTNN